MLHIGQIVTIRLNDFYPARNYVGQEAEVLDVHVSEDSGVYYYCKMSDGLVVWVHEGLLNEVFSVVTTYADLDSGGTGSAWFTVVGQQGDLDPEDLTVRMFEHFPRIIRLHNLQVFSEHRRRAGFYETSLHYRFDPPVEVTK